MSKTKIVGIVLAVLAIGAVVVWWIMSDNAKDKKVQQEIDAVVKVLDEASGDIATSAGVGSSESVPDSVEAPVEPSGDSSVNKSPFDLEKTIRLFHILDAGYEKSHNIPPSVDSCGCGLGPSPVRLG